MATSLYLASLEPDSGKSLVALGLMEMLSSRTEDVGYFRPVVPVGADDDQRIALMRGRYDLSLDPAQMAAYTAGEVEALLARGEREEVFKHILEAYKRVERECSFVLADGTDFSSVTAAFEFEFNIAVANHLGAPILTLVNGADRSVEDIVAAVRVAAESLADDGAVVAATVVNRVDRAQLDDVRRALEDDAADGDAPLWVVPDDPRLGMPTIAEIADALGTTELHGRELDADQEVSALKVAAMSVPNFLDHLEDGSLVIASGDRADVILGALATRATPLLPTVAGLVLTGGLDPAPQIAELLEAANLPALPVTTDTYQTASNVSAVRGVIRASNDRKVATALGLFERHVDVPALADRILHASELLRRRDVVDLVLLGDPDDVHTRADNLGIDLGDIPVIDPATAEHRADYARRYHEARRHKGITEEQASDTIVDVSYFGTMMVEVGHVDGMVSGAAHTTGHTIRPAFEFIRTRAGVDVVSSVFFMLLPDRVLVYGDCAVNPNPTAEQLADIAVASADTAATFGVEPLVAMLSYSTGESGSGEDVDRVREATRMARERRPDLKIEGPIQYDASVDPSVAESKLPGSEVAGHATVFIFPDLNTGNNTYKAVQRSANATAIGPVLQGLNKPVNDLSRGCTVADIVNTVAITAVQAQAQEDA
jgi:phosphate acetyltransferase